MKAENPFLLQTPRLGFLGIVVEDPKTAATTINQILSEYSDMIIGRMGLPYRERECAVITVMVDCTSDQLGALSGRLGQIPNVQVKSAMAKGSPKS